MRMARLVATVVATALVLVPAVVGLSGPAHAEPGDVITSFDVDVDVRDDGSFHVREEISYAFVSPDRHGIYRYVQTRYDIPEEPGFERLVGIDGIAVSSPTRAPTDTKVYDEGQYKVIRIGDEDRTISGEHTYVIDYDVTGAMNGAVNDFDYAELAWDATGNGWDAAIRRTRVTVTGPAAVQLTACAAGPASSELPCTSRDFAGSRAEFEQAGLGPFSGLTVAVGFPLDSIDVPPPVTEEKWSLGRAFSTGPWHLALALAVLVVGVGAVVWVVWSRGRDRRYVGQVPGLTPTGDEIAVEERKPLGGDNVVVSYTLPKDARPAEVGTLVDERADVLDVTAIIVDLAVRGYLRIEELPEEGLIFKKRDWRLVRLKESDESLRRYERTLLDALFAGVKNQVKLSDLKQNFADDLAKVQDQLYDEMLYNKWFRRRPDTTRTTWFVLGLVLAGAGVGLTILLAKTTELGWTGVAVTLAGLVLLVAGRYMPARTGRGSAALAQALGFRQYIRTAEAEQIRFEEREQVFSRYLPYAIVFGEAERWAKTFASLAAGGAAAAAGGAVSPGLHSLYWYGALGGFDADAFGSSLSDFTTTTAGSIAAAAPTSSSGSGFGGGGFSGGGFGGGGGGSW